MFKFPNEYSPRSVGRKSYPISFCVEAGIVFIILKSRIWNWNGISSIILTETGKVYLFLIVTWIGFKSPFESFSGVFLEASIPFDTYKSKISRPKKVLKTKIINQTPLYKFGKIKAQINIPIMPRRI